MKAKLPSSYKLCDDSWSVPLPAVLTESFPCAPQISST